VKELGYLNRYLLKYKWLLLFGIVFVIAANVFKVISPRILGFAIDMVAENISFYKSFSGFELQQLLETSFRKKLLIFCLIYFAAAILSGLFTFFMRQTIIVMSRYIEFDLKNEIYNHYQALDLAFYKRNNTGDLMNRITEDVSRVRMYLGPALMYGINVIFLFGFVIYTMLRINVNLTFWVLLPMPVLALSIFYVNGLINKSSEKIQEQLSNLTSHAQEYYSGIRVLKSFVQEKLALRFYENESEKYKDKSLDLARIEALFFPVMVFLIGLSNIIVIFVGGRQVMQGLISPGNLLEFVMYVNMLSWPITSIGWAASLIQRAAASQKRINIFLKTQPAITCNNSEKFNAEGSIEFRNVSFTYPDTGIQALKNVSFKINKGDKWAIIGKTGSGKSTIAELIFRLYDPTEGQILIDGKDIRNINLRDLRSQIGYVPQDVFLFSDSILNNIRFSDINISPESAQEAAKNASIHAEIEEFPRQYETLVGERGVTLSGGQKQRISIARALVKKPDILIFDDALSAVDAHTEKTILSNLKNSIEGKTVIIITHRIFSLIEFDKIMVLEDGMIQESGSHDELMNQNGHYAEIFNMQQMEQTTH
jgi:ATP-binding cassette, subfamily B, multidrug efflux pump